MSHDFEAARVYFDDLIENTGIVPREGPACDAAIRAALELAISAQCQCVYGENGNKFVCNNCIAGFMRPPIIQNPGESK